MSTEAGPDQIEMGGPEGLLEPEPDAREWVAAPVNRFPRSGIVGMQGLEQRQDPRGAGSCPFHQGTTVGFRPTAGLDKPSTGRHHQTNSPKRCNDHLTSQHLWAADRIVRPSWAVIG